MPPCLACPRGTGCMTSPAAPVSLRAAASPWSLTPPSPLSPRGEWRQGMRVILTGCLSTRCDTQGVTGVHQDIVLWLGVGDGAELPRVLGGAREQMDGRPGMRLHRTQPCPAGRGQHRGGQVGWVSVQGGSWQLGRDRCRWSRCGKGSVAICSQAPSSSFSVEPGPDSSVEPSDTGPAVSHPQGRRKGMVFMPPWPAGRWQGPARGFCGCPEKGKHGYNAAARQLGTA